MPSPPRCSARVRPLAAGDVTTITEAVRLRAGQVTMVGADVLVTAVPEGCRTGRLRVVFTGIVEEVGEVVEVVAQADAAGLRISGPLVTSDAAPGDSIAVNGVCLTVVTVADGVFTVDVMGRTLRSSGLSGLCPGSPVNLERALRAGSRLGGHLVAGHVDATGSVLAREASEHWELVRFSLPPRLARYLVARGSVAVDGVSLTVAEVDRDSFAVGLIPTTLRQTTLGRRRPGDVVNLEVDIVAKYVERLAAPMPPYPERVSGEEDDGGDE